MSKWRQGPRKNMYINAKELTQESNMPFYKIMIYDEIQNKTGLIKYHTIFWPERPCFWGISFARKAILAFLNYGRYIRKAILLEDSLIYKSPERPEQWLTDKLILEEKEMISPEVIERLIQEGADVTAGGNYAIQWAAKDGLLETLKVLHQNGADITANNNAAIRESIQNKHYKVAEYLLENGATILERPKEWTFANKYSKLQSLIDQFHNYRRQHAKNA